MTYHQTRRLKAPDGSRPAIDVMLVPLIKALWAADYETIGCCQDLGESLADHPREARYWKGYALLELPIEDACQLTEFVSDTPEFSQRMHWAADGAWDMSVPYLGLVLLDLAQIHFPNDQVADLVKVLARAALEGSTT